MVELLLVAVVIAKLRPLQPLLAPTKNPMLIPNFIVDQQTGVCVCMLVCVYMCVFMCAYTCVYHDRYMYITMSFK